MEYPISYLECVTSRDAAPKVNKIIRSDEVGRKLIIHLPEDVPIQGTSLYNIEAVVPEVGPIYFDCKHMPCDCCGQDRPWLYLPSQLFDFSVGYHLYRLSFLVEKTRDMFYCYISYTLQDSDPEKPYIYMNKEER